MNIDNLFRNIRVLWRADAIIAQMQLQHQLTGLGLRALAALIAAVGLLMLELAAYFALVQTWSAIVAAIVLAAVNFAIALIIIFVAARRKSGRDMELLWIFTSPRWRLYSQTRPRFRRTLPRCEARSRILWIPPLLRLSFPRQLPIRTLKKARELRTLHDAGEDRYRAQSG